MINFLCQLYAFPIKEQRCIHIRGLENYGLYPTEESAALAVRTVLKVLISFIHQAIICGTIPA